MRIGVVGADGGETLDRDARTIRATATSRRLDWIDASTVAIQQLNRLQNRNDYLLADAATGASRRAFRDQSDTWVDVQDEVAWIDNGRSFLWISERDGWRHVYRVPKEGGDADADHRVRRGCDRRRRCGRARAVFPRVAVERDAALSLSVPLDGSRAAASA